MLIVDVVICNSNSGKAEWWKEISFGESISRGNVSLEINRFLRASNFETYFTQEEKAPGKTANFSSK